MQTQILEQTAELFDQYRGLLFSIAYRMLSSATDAEDIVQEAFVRWMQAEAAEVQSPKAYLATVVTRLCIDQLRAASAQRERYIGPWLPEPILTDAHPELAENAILAESLGFAFLIMLEQLGPLERAVFLLREVFDYGYAEIAAIVGKSETNCRQILHRAHQRLGQRRPRYDVSAEQQTRITELFLRATAAGDMQGLLELLTDDIVFMADGGGQARAGLKPVVGPDKVARGTLGGLRPLLSQLEPRLLEVNGQPALVGYINGAPYGVTLLELEGQRIRRIYTVVNPAKLRWLRLDGGLEPKLVLPRRGG